MSPDELLAAETKMLGRGGSLRRSYVTELDGVELVFIVYDADPIETPYSGVHSETRYAVGQDGRATTSGIVRSWFSSK